MAYRAIILTTNGTDQTFIYMHADHTLVVFMVHEICFLTAMFYISWIYETSRNIARKAPANTTIAEFANTVDPDETVHDEPFHLDLQCFCPLVFDFST